MAEYVDRQILNVCEEWPMMPYPDGVSTLVEYRKGKPVVHCVPHTGPLTDMYLPIVAAHYRRTLRG